MDRRENDRRYRSRAEMLRDRRRRRKRTCLIELLIVLFFIIVVVAVAGIFVWKKYGPSKVKADLNEYYGVDAAEQAAVIVNNTILEQKGIVSDGQFYLPYEAVRQEIDGGFYWNAAEGTLRYTLPLDLVEVPAESKEYTNAGQRESKDYVIVKNIGDQTYIAVDFILEFGNVTAKTYKSPNRVVLFDDWGKVKTTTAKKDTQMRWLAGVKSDVLAEVKKGNRVYFIEEEGDWKKVRTEDGIIGYIKSSALKSVKTETITSSSKAPEYTSMTKDYKINLAWHQVTNEIANETLSETIASTQGLTTISPTWFTVADTVGNLNSIASSAYVDTAHAANLEVWALVRDFDGGIDSPEETYQLLSSSLARKTLIDNLMMQVQQYNIDGINVDFEKVSEECGEHFIEFIRELSIECRRNQKVLSVDNYVPMGFNSHYELEEQGKVADYVIIMGYDEHYAGSWESGSVASIDYVENGIRQATKDVSAEKVINAVPFYTRLWEEVPKTEQELAAQAGTEQAQYKMNVTSEALGMQEAEACVAQAGAAVTWDEETQQNYAQWESDGATYKIWLEDSSSIEAKLKLMEKYQLGGVAAWKLGFEKPEIWSVIEKYIK